MERATRVLPLLRAERRPIRSPATLHSHPRVGGQPRPRQPMRIALPALRGVLVYLLLLISPQQAIADTTVAKFDGDYADFYVQMGSVSCWLGVWRGTDNGIAQTYLNYSCHDSALALALLSGYGTIPNANLKVYGHGAELETDTSTNATFTHSVGVGGAVSIRWSKNGVYESRQSGVYQLQTPTYRYKHNGTSRSWSAVAAGDLAGFSFEQSNGGAIGLNKAVTVVIERP